MGASFKRVLRRTTAVSLFGAILLALVWLTGWRLFAAPEPPGSRDDPLPQLVLDRTRHDFGIVTAGATLKAEFVVTNAGGHRLILREGSRSCECVSGTFPKIIIPPGASKPLVAALETRKILGPAALEVRYWTNDPRTPVVTLTLLADVAATP
jgi:hypothetical protein